METAGGADELPPIAVGSVAGAVGRQEMVVAIAPDGTFAPGVAAVAPIGPAGGPALGFPVETLEVGLGACDGGLSGGAPFKAIGAGFPGGGVGVGTIADFREGRSVAQAIDKIFGAYDGSGRFPSRSKVGSEGAIPAGNTHPGPGVGMVVGPTVVGGYRGVGIGGAQEQFKFENGNGIVGAGAGTGGLGDVIAPQDGFLFDVGHQ